MQVGVPREVKNREQRVALTPSGAHELVGRGHEVLVEAGAGEGSSVPDDAYAEAGARVVPTAADAWGAELVLKVKEPVPSEHRFLREDLLLFAYLHLAADRPLTEALVASRATSVAYETVQLPDRSLPLLAPMSEVAGRLAPQVGAYTLMSSQGGRGVLMGGVPGVRPADVVVIGGGVSGAAAARVAVGIGAEVTLLDRDITKLRHLDELYAGRLRTVASNPLELERAVLSADLVVGAVLVPGARAPKLVTDDLVARMRPGSVLVDIAVDQGGCFEGTRATTHDDPTFAVHGSVFYCVANMPGAVPHTSTYALTNVTLPYVVELADAGWQDAMRRDAALAGGLTTHAGSVANAGVAQAHDLPLLPLEDALS
ncbi:alanine dehydrogenase [Pseudokineococcus basanitobsidens]|uniref:Alanine dehydrogenase n=1 Tax=Pseudokineococcus basanitobsidens TaxID=1926649 RepID=A0ABU8RKD7_9ACTN